MAEEEIKVIINGEDRTDKAFASATQNAKKYDTTISGTFERIKTAYGKVKGVFDDLDQVYDATIGKVMSYAAEVKQMTEISGASAEDVSRLAQVFDDLGLSTQSLQTAMEGAAKKGIVLTVDKLADLSDQYRAISDQQAKQKFLLDNLGRAGLEYARVMDLGSKAIRDRSAAISDGLVLTDQELAQTEKLRVAQDNFNDTLQDTSNTISMKAIPALTFLLSPTQDINQAYQEMIQSYRDMDQPQSQVVKGMGDLKKAEEDLNNQMIVTDGTITVSSGHMNDLAVAHYNAVDAENANKDAAEILTGAMGNLTSQELFNQASAGLDASASLDLAEKMGLINDRSKDALTGLQILRGEFDAGKLSVEEYTNKVAAWQNYIKNIPDNIHKTLTFDVIVNGGVPGVNMSPNPGQTPPGTNQPTNTQSYVPPPYHYASGGSYVVPAGYNENWPVGPGHYASSGETVTVTPTHIMNVYPTFVNANGQGVVDDLNFFAKQYGMV